MFQKKNFLITWLQSNQSTGSTRLSLRSNNDNLPHLKTLQSERGRKSPLPDNSFVEMSVCTFSQSHNNQKGLKVGTCASQSEDWTDRKFIDQLHYMHFMFFPYL